MKIWESIRLSLRSIRTNKLRSFLTTLGIIIGVAAVITLVSIGQGASKSIESQVAGLGSNLLIVTPGQAQQGGVNMGQGSLESLSLEDANAIAKQPSIAGVAPSVSKQAQLIWKNKNYQTSVEGTSETFPQVRSTPVQSGRFFSRFEVTGQANVAVLGTEVVTNLFGSPNANVIGQTVQINQMPFTVIGVLQTQGSSGVQNNDDRVIVPVTTAMNRLFDIKKVRTFYVSAKSADLMTQAQFETQTALRAQHHIAPRQADDFQIRNQSQVLSTAQGIASIMTALLAGIAAISLVVGGIGIMNIMLVSVTERTREIGIRKAIGATSGAILGQFLIESVVLSLMGGVIGILIGVGLAKLIGSVSTLTTVVNWQPIVYSFVFSMLVGVIFGVYPARKASRLNPIDALRYE